MPTEETKLALVQQDIAAMKSMFGDLAEAIKALTATLKQEYVTQQQFKPLENLVYWSAKTLGASLLTATAFAIYKVIFK